MINLRKFNIDSLKNIDLNQEIFIKLSNYFKMGIKFDSNIYYVKIYKGNMIYAMSFNNLDDLILFLENLKTMGIYKFITRKNFSYFF